MEKPVRLLLIEDDQDDAFFILSALRDGGLHFDHLHVQTADTLKEAIARPDWDLVLSDYSLPGFNGLDALEIVREYQPDTPFILVSGAIGETLAVELMKKGAQDYIMKNDLTRLVPAVKRELQEAQMRQEKRETEQQLLKSEEQYHSLFKGVPIGLYQSTPEGRRLNANPAFVSIFGYASLEACLKVGAQDQYVNPEDYQRLQEQLQVHHEVINYQTQLYRADGSVIWGKKNVKAVFGPGGQVLFYEGSVEDVTAQKMAEAALRASEERYRLLHDLSPDGIIIADNAGVITSCNPAVLSMTGFKENEFIGQPFILLSDLLQDKAWTIREQYEFMPVQGGVRQFEFEWRDKSGVSRWSQMQISRLIQGTVDLGIQALFRDITTRKLMELEVKQARDRLRAIIDNAPLYLHIMDLENRFVLVNEQYCSAFHLNAEAFIGKSIPDVLGDGVDEIYPLDLQAQHNAQNALVLEQNGPMVFEDVFPMPEGEELSVITTKFPLYDKTGQPEAVCTLLLDISERKQKELQIQRSLREKEVLLKEVHHRVKNNLQVIISLLNLQANRIGDTQLLSAFHTSRDRIYSMALVHERLYQSQDFAYINFADYIKQMGHAIQQTYASAAVIKLNYDLEPVKLGIDAAIPCGLIVNELLTNALVHAFTGRTKGVVEVVLEEQEGSMIQLSVADNGVGLDAAIDVESGETMGFQLVSILASQLDGTWEVKRDAGTCAEIRFPGENIPTRHLLS